MKIAVVLTAAVGLAAGWSSQAQALIGRAPLINDTAVI